MIFLKIWSNYGYWKSQKPLDYSILAIYINIASKKKGLLQMYHHGWMDGWMACGQDNWNPCITLWEHRNEKGLLHIWNSIRTFWELGNSKGGGRWRGGYCRRFVWYKSLTNDYSTWHLESGTRVKGVTTPGSYRTFTCQVTVCRKAGMVNSR